MLFDQAAVTFAPSLAGSFPPFCRIGLSATMRTHRKIPWSLYRAGKKMRRTKHFVRFHRCVDVFVCFAGTIRAPIYRCAKIEIDGRIAIDRERPIAVHTPYVYAAKIEIGRIQAIDENACEMTAVNVALYHFVCIQICVCVCVRVGERELQRFDIRASDVIVWASTVECNARL